MAEETYDLIVVGSSAGGDSIAAKLELPSCSVPDLKAGVDYCGFDYRVPWFPFHHQPRSRKKLGRVRSSL